MTWLIFLGVVIIIIVIVIVRFTNDVKKQNQQVLQQGGMKKKYAVLINYCLKGDNRSTILYEKASSIAMGLANIGGSTIFTLTQTFGAVAIQWKVDSPIFGKHQLEWNFKDSMDQTNMIEIIGKDLMQYQKNDWGYLII